MDGHPTRQVILEGFLRLHFKSLICHRDQRRLAGESTSLALDSHSWQRKCERNRRGDGSHIAAPQLLRILSWTHLTSCHLTLCRGSAVSTLRIPSGRHVLNSNRLMLTTNTTGSETTATSNTDMATPETASASKTDTTRTTQHR